MDYSESATAIIDAVGGKGNINNAWHCITRLRFDLKDELLIDHNALDALPFVMGSLTQNGQFQVVIGNDVASYCEPLLQQIGLKQHEEVEEGDAREHKGIVAKFMDIVSGTFGPIVPAIAGAGMIKGLMAGLAAIGVISSTTDTYVVLDMLASGVFTFLPFFVAASAARIFRTNQYLAVAIAAAMQYPSMSSAAAAGKITRFMLFGTVPVPVFSYAGTVIPIIFSVLVLSHVWRRVDKLLPAVMRTVFTPLISLFVTEIIALCVIGPIGIFLGDLLADGVGELFAISPALAGFVCGVTRPILVFTGLHHAMTPVALQNFANQGWDMLMPTMFMANLSIMGATAALYLKAKTAQEKALIASAVVAALLGITEPALFGILSKCRRAFIAACLGSGISSAVICLLGVRIYGYILSSIFSLVAYIGPYFPFAILGVVVAAGSSFAIAWLLMARRQSEASTTVEPQM